VTDRGNHL